ncbi:MAG: hydantoinase B/oxoprolinase family protein [Gammaproteobacteria bacterium]|nr:hydantoinase B/oxoprolinase family protein [Gammaproteobacteria bacterium]
MDAIELSIFSSRIAAACDEMGAVLRRAAFSTNIKDRLDYSCAVFDPQGQLCAQAAHIPVHLGSMAYAMRDLVAGLQWAPGDMVVVNDPYLGGTHLPDVTLIAPVYLHKLLIGFVANRAHHADIGAHSPGSMPVSRSLEEEGLIISPRHLLREDRVVPGCLEAITAATANPQQMDGDMAAQISANHTGVQRLLQLAGPMGAGPYLAGLDAVNDYAARLAAQALKRIPDGHYRFEDIMEDDGAGGVDIRIAVSIRVAQDKVDVDFSGTAGQVQGNINCPLSVAAAGVYYVFRCLMPEHTPACAGSFRCISLTAPEGCLLNARRPAAVAAGNVETSSRVVDVVMGALARAIPDRVPAASQGTMNNLAMGSRDGGRAWDYYETLGGGMGAGCQYDGLSATQSHMTNTLNTPIEVLEMNFPLRLLRYQVRDRSGGAGRYRGGDGLVREYEFLEPATVTLLTERRRTSPWGLAGGEHGACGENWCGGKCLPAKTSFRIQAGERLTLCTPGGGGWGSKLQKQGPL